MKLIREGGEEAASGRAEHMKTEIIVSSRSSTEWYFLSFFSSKKELKIRKSSYSQKQYLKFQGNAGIWIFCLSGVPGEGGKSYTEWKMDCWVAWHNLSPLSPLFVFCCNEIPGPDEKGRLASQTSEVKSLQSGLQFPVLSHSRGSIFQVGVIADRSFSFTYEP